MATTTEKLEDPNLNEDDKDAIVGAFVRHQENERLRKYWEKLLREKHQVTRPPAHKKPSGVVRKLILPALAVAATLLLLFFMLPDLRATSGTELLATNLTQITIEGARSSTTTEADSIRRVLRAAYLAGDFPTAAASGQDLLTLPSATEEDKLNLGITQLRAKNYPLAIQHFNQLLEQSGNFMTEARFYLALSQLSSGNTAAGLTELRKIKETDGRSIYQKAQALISARW